ncbi:hypothetical protein EAG_09714 [Camponotus floridanus]|uniref:Uncharacterized protein n=1 Tax=Camponotus floridanus TaxID=104421 RepID=E2A2R4_CAMFO|nr:hypothetical protein EAG_09714 [Camponotus floridanus]
MDKLDCSIEDNSWLDALSIWFSSSSKTFFLSSILLLMSRKAAWDWSISLIILVSRMISNSVSALLAYSIGCEGTPQNNAVQFRSCYNSTTITEKIPATIFLLSLDNSFNGKTTARITRIELSPSVDTQYRPK